MARLDKWLNFFACIIHQFFVSGTLKANGVILQSVANRFGTSYTLVAWCFGLQSGLIFMISPVSKILLEKFTFRELSVVGGLLTGAGYIYCALKAATVTEMFTSLVISGLGLGLSDLPHYLSLEQHFKEDFPKMTTLTSISHFVGVAAFPPLVQYFMEEYGLQGTLFLMGAILWNTVAGGVGLIHRTPRAKQGVKDSFPLTEPRTVEGSDTPKSKKIHCKENDSLLVEETEGKAMSSFEKYLPGFSVMFHHRNFSILAICEVFAFYIYTSWALFLVSLGTTQGLAANQAALLSTAGGVAGVFGRLAAALFFHFNNIDAIVGNQLPFFVNGITLFGCVFARNFYILAVLTVFSGFSQGFNQASLLGLLPSQVCYYHFRQAAVINFSLDGIFMQFGGLLSGVIVDVMGSTVYVFAFNAILCFVILPLGFLWVRDQDQPVKNCNPDTN